MELDRIIQGDCMDVLPSIASGTIDLVVTDPPYAIPTLVSQGRTHTSNLGDFSIVENYFHSWFITIHGLLKPEGRAFVFCDSTSYPVVFRSSYGLFRTALLVWDKNRIGMGREFRKSFELILHAWKPESPIACDGTGHSDILTFDPVPSQKRLHPAEKPVSLLKYLIDRFTKVGGLVLDPFCGSGSTCLAAQVLNRHHLGIEIEPDFVKVANARLNQKVLT